VVRSEIPVHVAKRGCRRVVALEIATRHLMNHVTKLLRQVLILARPLAR
jgi:hypothetical protein